MQIKLHKRQSVAFQTEATEVLYGGAAGGGKSYLLRISGIRWCLEVPGVQVYLFRRTLPDLRANHLRGPTSLHALLAEYIASGYVQWRGQENEFRFGNGSCLRLSYCQYEDDVLKYLGAEIHVLLMDELTLFTEYQYSFLRSRVRMTGISVPEQHKGRLPRIESASNPGSVGHAWVKRTFVSPREPEAIWRAPDSEGGMVRQYIPARLSDNPTLTEEDPAYLQRLEGLGTPELVRAMRDGDWDIVAGQALEKLRRDVHCIRPFAIPDHWLRFRSMDWGSSKPFSVGWWAVSDGTLEYPRGALIRYREWYGWNGNPDQGLRMESTDVAKKILELEQGEKITYGVADPAIFSRHDGPSIAEKMGKCRVYWKRGDNNRLLGFEEVRGRIAGDEPMLYVFESCHDGFWRTMPDLVIDSKKWDDVDTDQEDHVFDEVRYACMSRPFVKSQPEPPRQRRQMWDKLDKDDSDGNWKIA